MTRFCIVAPSSILVELTARNELGTAHLLLAHDVVVRSDVYYELFYPNRITSERLIILDNSVVETGNAVDLNTIATAYNATIPTCVVLPDVQYNPDATILNCKMALEEWPLFKGFLNPPKFMFVPQGRTLKDFVRCAEAFASDEENPHITFWGVPRNLVNPKTLGTRKQAIELLHILNPNRKIHMLGFSDNMIDDVSCAQHPAITSVDSAVPLRYSKPLSLVKPIPPRGDWWETAKYTPQVLENLKIARRWFGDTSS